MYTQCPACKTTYRITTDKIRSGQGKVLCSHCYTVFDSISSLADVAFENNFANIHSVPILPVERSVLPKSEDDESWAKFERSAHADSGKIRWCFAALSMMVLLVAQIITYQAPSWAQNQEIRPWLNTFCDKIDCRLPKYRHPEDIEVIERALEPAGYDTLKFRLVIVNNGSLPVALPEIYMKLVRFNGEPLAQRIFAPDEYFGDTVSMSELPVGKPIELSFKIVNPDNEIAGYTFQFI